MTVSFPSMSLHHLVRFGNGQAYEEADPSADTYPVLGSGGEFAQSNDYLYDGESVLFGRKGTIDKPLYVNGRFWTVDTMYYTIPGPLVEPRWLYYWATTVPFGLLSTSTALPSMTSAALGRLKVPLPPRDEQCRVAELLDRETARIDAVIEKQRALVRGLRERRQETIEIALHQKATGGVVMPLSAACSAIIDCNHSTPVVDPQGKHRAVRTGSVRSGSYRPEFDLLISSETYEERTQGARPALGDVLFTREAPAGEACLVPMNDVLCLGQRMVLLRPNSSLLHPSFLVYWIYRRSTQDYFRLQMNGSTVGNVRLGDIRSMKIALPSVGRQRAIVDYLDNKSARIDTLIARSERLIELSQERRAALITAAVTGQLDIPSDTKVLEGAA